MYFMKWGEGGGKRQHCWAFAHVWAWEKGTERGREERVGGEKNGGAGCQGYGPLALGSPGLGPDPGGVVSWEERKRKEREKQVRCRVRDCLTRSDWLEGRG